MGDKRGLAFALNNLGDVTLRQGDIARATACQEESLDVRRALGNGEGAAVSLGGLGDIARAQGDYRRAATTYAESITLLHASDDTAPPSLSWRRSRPSSAARGIPGRNRAWTPWPVRRNSSGRWRACGTRSARPCCPWRALPMSTTRRGCARPWARGRSRGRGEKGGHSHESRRSLPPWTPATLACPIQGVGRNSPPSFARAPRIIWPCYTPSKDTGVGRQIMPMYCAAICPNCRVEWVWRYGLLRALRGHATQALLHQRPPYNDLNRTFPRLNRS